jgi:hypothetical protein
MQSLAPEPAAQRHAEVENVPSHAQDAYVGVSPGTQTTNIGNSLDTGPHGLSSIQRDAVQAIIRHCFEARQEYLDAVRSGKMELNSGGENATAVVMAQAEYIGFAAETFGQILEECRRLT